MTVTLTKELEKMVRQQVKGGHFQNTGEAIRHAIRHTYGTTAEPAWLEAEIEKGFASGEPQPLTGKDFEKIRRRIRSQSRG